MRSIVWVILGSLLLGFAGGCTLVKSYRREPCEYARTMDGYQLAIVEFDDHGDFWNSRQLDAAVNMIKEANKSRRGARVLTFVHGWHDDASPKNETGNGNLHFLEQELHALSAATAKGEDRPATVGVYLAWRGDSTRFPGPFSFYNRLEAAERIAAGPAITKTLLSILTVTRTNPLSRSLVVGHSMGALILERTMMKIVIADEVAAEFDPTRAIACPADLILLINAAAPALYARNFITLLKAHTAPINPEYGHGDLERPVVVALTSAGDGDTGRWFPIGMTIGSFLERFRTYHDGSGDAPGEGKVYRQQYLWQHTAEHTKELWSHRVEVSTEAVEATAEPSVQPCLPEESGTHDLCFRVTGDGQRIKFNFRRVADGSFNGQSNGQSKYWIMEVPSQVLPDHSKIFNQRTFERMLGGILTAFSLVPPEKYVNLQHCVWHDGMRVAGPGQRERLPYELRSECVRNWEAAPTAESPAASQQVAGLTDIDIQHAVSNLKVLLDSDYKLKDHLQQFIAVTDVPSLRQRLKDDLDGVRLDYSATFVHDANARNLLAALDDCELRGRFEDLLSLPEDQRTPCAPVPAPTLPPVPSAG